jgi:hypothetical protein
LFAESVVPEKIPFFPPVRAHPRIAKSGVLSNLRLELLAVWM